MHSTIRWPSASLNAQLLRLLFLICLQDVFSWFLSLHRWHQKAGQTYSHCAIIATEQHNTQMQVHFNQIISYQQDGAYQAVSQPKTFLLETVRRGKQILLSDVISRWQTVFKKNTTKKKQRKKPRGHNIFLWVWSTERSGCWGKGLD